MTQVRPRQAKEQHGSEAQEQILEAGEIINIPLGQARCICL